METTNRIAFKEWATICAALESRGQIAILRKGGIHEGRQGFRVAYPEFWLFPTYVHQDVRGLVDEPRHYWMKCLPGDRPRIRSVWNIMPWFGGSFIWPVNRN